MFSWKHHISESDVLLFDSTSENEVQVFDTEIVAGMQECEASPLSLN